MHSTNGMDAQAVSARAPEARAENQGSETMCAARDFASKPESDQKMPQIRVELTDGAHAEQLFLFRSTRHQNGNLSRQFCSSSLCAAKTWPTAPVVGTRAPTNRWATNSILSKRSGGHPRATMQHDWAVKSITCPSSARETHKLVPHLLGCHWQNTLLILTAFDLEATCLETRLLATIFDKN